MTADIKPYPAYKDSGVPWLGQVPEHWGIRRLGALLQERRETNEDLRVMDVLSVLRDRGVIPYAEKGNIGNKKSEDITRYKIVRPNDIVVNCMNVIIGSVGLSQYTGCLSPVYYVLTRRSDADDPRYLNAYFQTKPFQRSLVRIGNGILSHRMRIPMELLKGEPFPRPPSHEQAAIVRYLDHADRKVRHAIRARQQLIKLLTEQKQAIIQRAATRGLDPNVRLKPSGVPWLGDIPEHWETRRLKQVARMNPSKSEAALALTGDTLVTFLPMHRVGTTGLVDSREKRCASEVWNGFTYFRRSDVLVAKITPCFENGKGACLDSLPTEIGFGSTEFIVLRVLRKVLPQYLYRLTLLPDFRHLGADAMIGAAGQQRVPATFVGSFSIPVPPLSEQSAIVCYLDAATADLEKAIDAARREIELLREYRTRLIADVVTGKLDVRDVPVPDDETDVLPEEPEDIDDPDAMDQGDDITEENSDSSAEESA